ncbi:MAG: hypothetical protein ACRDD1_08605, partial [Planctomycetia bacterium]
MFRRFALSLLICASSTLFASESRVVEVAEIAGVRRWSYPAQIIVPGPIAAGTRFRLLDAAGVAAPLQATIVPGDRPADPNQASLWFPINLEAGQTVRLTLTYGADVEPDPPPSGRLKIDRRPADGVFDVQGVGGLRMAVPQNLVGLLRSARNAKVEWLRPESLGLTIRNRDGALFRAGVVKQADEVGKPTTATVLEPGPFVARLRFTGEEAVRDGVWAPAVLDLTFPTNRSWMAVDWRVDDTAGNVAGLDATLHLLLDVPGQTDERNRPNPPTTVDFGVPDYVYQRVVEGEIVRLRAGLPAARDPKDSRPAADVPT